MPGPMLRAWMLPCQSAYWEGWHVPQSAGASERSIGANVEGGSPWGASGIRQCRSRNASSGGLDRAGATATVSGGRVRAGAERQDQACQQQGTPEPAHEPRVARGLRPAPRIGRRWYTETP